MTALAEGQRDLQLATGASASTGVLLAGHGLKVRGVHAATHAAEVVDLKAFGDPPEEQAVNVDDLSADPCLGVTATARRAHPEPAPGRRLRRDPICDLGARHEQLGPAAQLLEQHVALWQKGVPCASQA
jgi:hypothetical protein